MVSFVLFSDDCSMLYLYPETQLLFSSTVAFNVLCCFMHKSALLKSSILYEASTSPDVPNMQMNGFLTKVFGLTLKVLLSVNLFYQTKTLSSQQPNETFGN